MDFEFRSSIYISEEDLEELAQAVREGQSFDDAYDELVCGWDDCDYGCSGYIAEAVEAEVLRRVG